MQTILKIAESLGITIEKRKRYSENQVKDGYTRDEPYRQDRQRYHHRFNDYRGQYNGNRDDDSNDYRGQYNGNRDGEYN